MLHKTLFHAGWILVALSLIISVIGLIFNLPTDLVPFVILGIQVPGFVTAMVGLNLMMKEN